MRTAAFALSADEVAVGGARHARAFFRAVVVHREAHRAPRQTPLKAGIRENLGNAFGFGHFANRHRARNGECAHAGSNLAALGDSRSFTEVFNAAICA